VNAFSTMGYAELILEKVADLASRLGIPYHELWSLEGSIKLPELLDSKLGG
jgi:hypothetical protein